jgi:hypothetical protein
MASAGHLDQKKLINAINHLHFKGTPLYVLLNHAPYGEMILVQAHPEPCLGDELTLHWDKAYAGYNLDRYQSQYLALSHDQAVILVPVQVTGTNGRGLTVKLPEQALLISKRQAPRYAGQDVRAELWQNGFQAEGALLDFGSQAFRLRLQSPSPSSFHWFNSDMPATIRLSNSREVLYAGLCHCLYQKPNGQVREIVVTPLHDQIQRFKSKTLRNPRRKPAFPLQAVFEHPLTGKRVQREIADISTSGFALRDASGEAALMPGLIIPEMDIAYAGMIKIRCKAQIIHRRVEEAIHYGLSILDMDLNNYNHLSQLLSSISGCPQALTGEVDLDQLWELFFESDFIYPEKYRHIQGYREQFQQTYRKLYAESPQIARHFTYQKDGRIYSHISLLRAYHRTWMAHHHAARAEEGRHTGLFVLKQLISYLYDMNRLPSAFLDYYLCFYRPGNKFTDRIYTGFAQERSSVGGCSMDLYAYLTLSTRKEPRNLPEGWRLREPSPVDLWEFEQFYRHHSGGLLLNILALDDQAQGASLAKVYADLGMTRRWKALVLQFNGETKALIIVEESDVAVNLSDLLNGFKVLVLDPAAPAAPLMTALENLASAYPLETVPALIYPAEYAKNRGLTSEKHYLMWIMDAQLGNDFVEYLGRRFRINFN